MTETKTLSDEIIPPTCHKNYENIKVEVLKKHLQKFKEELEIASEDNDWEFATDDGNKEGFRIIDGKEFIDTQMQKHFGEKLLKKEGGEK